MSRSRQVHRPLKGARKSRYYQFTAIDDCTRLRVLRIYDRSNQETAIQFLDYVCQKLPSTRPKPIWSGCWRWSPAKTSNPATTTAAGGSPDASASTG